MFAQPHGHTRGSSPSLMPSTCVTALRYAERTLPVALGLAAVAAAQYGVLPELVALTFVGGLGALAANRELPLVSCFVTCALCAAVARAQPIDRGSVASPVADVRAKPDSTRLAPAAVRTSWLEVASAVAPGKRL